VIQSGALINQKSRTGSGQAVTVQAINHNETVNLGGSVGFNGALVLNVVQNKTLSQIESGAIIDLAERVWLSL
jgi:hypothetical protein